MGYRPFWRLALSAAVAVGALGFAAGCSHGSVDSNGPLSGVDAQSSFEVTNDRVQVGQTLRVGAILLCTKDGKHAVLDRLDGVGVDGPVVVEPAMVQPAPAVRQIGTSVDALPPDRYQPIGGAAVATKCGESPGAELVIQLRRTATGDGGAKSFTLFYRVGQKAYLYRMPISVVLCDATVSSPSGSFTASCHK